MWHASASSALLKVRSYTTLLTVADGGVIDSEPASPVTLDSPRSLPISRPSTRCSHSTPIICAAITLSAFVEKSRTPIRYAAMNASSSVTNVLMVVWGSVNILFGK
jgi:hypothetical protein